jgi:tetratricopeptide (TPR) repeat protein
MKETPMKPLLLCLSLFLAAGLSAGGPGSLSEANALLGARDFEKAAKAYEALGKQASIKREGWRQNNWGLALLRLNKPALAVERLEDAVKVDPRNFTARANLATAWERVGDRVKAADVYRRALELLKEENTALQSGKAPKDEEAKANVDAQGDTQAAQLNEKASTLKGDDLKNALRNASELLDQAKYQEAADAYAAIGQTAPAKREGWRLNNWGLCYLRMGNPEEARPRLEASVEAFPGNPVAWNNLAVAYEQLGLAEQAKDAYAKAGEGAGDKGMDPMRFELGQLKLDFAAERRRWEALGR